MDDRKSPLVDCDYAELERRVLAQMAEQGQINTVEVGHVLTGRRPDKTLRFLVAYGPKA